MKDNLKVDKTALKKALKTISSGDLCESTFLNEVYIMLSLDCNLKCDFCIWWGREGPCHEKKFLKKYSPCLTLKEFRKLASDVAVFNPYMVTFSGGEPLLYEKWHLPAQYFKQKGIKVCITTNGILLNDNFQKITELVDQVNISLEGSPDFISRIADNDCARFEKTVEGLKRLTKFKRNNRNKPLVRLLYTISDTSYSYMAGLLKFMRENEILIDHYAFQHLMFINRDTFELQQEVFAKKFGIKQIDFWKGFTSGPSKINFSKFKKEIKAVSKLTNVSFHPDLYDNELKPYYSCNSGVPRYSSYCTGAWRQANILPNGDVYICPDYFVGNIKRNSFKSIWNGKKIKTLRAYLIKNLFPGCKGCFYYYCDRNE